MLLHLRPFFKTKNSNCFYWQQTLPDLSTQPMFLMSCKKEGIGQIVKKPVIILAFICLILLNKWPLSYFCPKEKEELKFFYCFAGERKSGVCWLRMEDHFFSSLGSMISRERFGSWEGQREKGGRQGRTGRGQGPSWSGWVRVNT